VSVKCTCCHDAKLTNVHGRSRISAGVNTWRRRHAEDDYAVQEAKSPYSAMNMHAPDRVSVAPLVGNAELPQ
jgi:nitrate reductase cytochrome c-type subunit